MNLTLEETNKRHKELWQGIIDYVRETGFDELPSLKELKNRILIQQDYENRKPLLDCWLCEYYRTNCKECPLKSCHSGDEKSHYTRANNAFITLVKCSDVRFPGDQKIHKEHFISVAEQIRDIVD